jgi:toxin ParE1/3/4
MAYRVEVLPRARRDVRAIYEYIGAHDSAQAREWFNGLEALMSSLEKHSSRGAATSENQNLRQLLYGNKPHSYRIIYAIDEASRLGTFCTSAMGRKRRGTAEPGNGNRFRGPPDTCRRLLGWALARRATGTARQQGRPGMERRSEQPQTEPRPRRLFSHMRNRAVPPAVPALIPVRAITS